MIILVVFNYWMSLIKNVENKPLINSHIVCVPNTKTITITCTFDRDKAQHPLSCQGLTSAECCLGLNQCLGFVINASEQRERAIKISFMHLNQAGGLKCICPFSFTDDTWSTEFQTPPIFTQHHKKHCQLFTVYFCHGQIILNSPLSRRIFEIK